MKHYIKRKNELVTTNWGGGSTTELFIYPPDSEYKKRNFEVRISSAAVEQSPSEFTVLEGYLRLLMPLTADLALDFPHGKVCLKPFESVLFEGGWQTVSRGICTDIGIMFSSNWMASLTATGSGMHNCNNGFTFVYCLSDNTTVSTKDFTHTLGSGDFLIMETSADDKITLSTNNVVILMSIGKN